jgi:hypothetical protein
LDRDLGVAFAQMEMIGAGQAMTGVDGEDGAPRVVTRAAWVVTGLDRVVIRPDGVMARPNGVEIRGVHNISAEEQSKLLADVAAYKARISFLESKLFELGFIEDTTNDDSVTWAEELFEDRGVEDRSVEQPKNQAED